MCAGWKGEHPRTALAGDCQTNTGNLIPNGQGSKPTPVRPDPCPILREPISPFRSALTPNVLESRPIDHPIASNSRKPTLAFRLVGPRPLLFSAPEAVP
jgi:hypothetical protein